MGEAFPNTKGQGVVMYINRKDLRHEHLHCDLHTVTAVASVCGHAGEWPGPLGMQWPLMTKGCGSLTNAWWVGGCAQFSSLDLTTMSFCLQCTGYRELTAKWRRIIGDYNGHK